MAGAPSSSSGSKAKKRKRKGEPRSLPPLPAVEDEDLAVSDEDVAFFRKHGTYAKLLAKMDTRKIDRSLQGGKDKLDDVEAQYEKKRRKEPATESAPQGLQLEPADVLPVKTLEGKLLYRPPKEDGAAGPSTLEERRAAIRKQQCSIPAEAEGQEEAAGLDGVEHAVDEEAEQNEDEPPEKPKLNKKQRREELKKAQREDKRRIDEGPAAEVGRGKDLAALEEYASLQERRAAMRVRLAEIGSAVLAEPEEQLQKGALKELLSLCSDEDIPVAQLAMLSTMAVFKDICPGYKIRLPTAKELEVKVSKDVKRLRDFEAQLLHSYQAFVQLLVKVAKLPARRAAAVRCLCGLTVALPHFNFRESLLAAIIPRMDSADDDISNECCSAVQDLFKGTGSPYQAATLEAVQLIADLVRQRRCRLRPEVIRVFTSLRFDEDLVRASGSSSSDKGRKGPIKSKKAARAEKRKLAAQLKKQVEEDVREAEAVLHPSERRRLQSETVAAVFETYFRVLKDAAVVQPKASQAGDGSGAAELGPRPLLTTALAGLAKFSYLVSVEFMGDLLEVLRQLAMSGSSAVSAEPIEGGDTAEGALSLEEQLRCCLVAFHVVKGALDALNVDLRDFYVRLYQLLWELPFAPTWASMELGGVLAETLQAMVWEARQLDVARVAAFSKRLASASLHFPTSGEAMPALLSLRRLLQRHSHARTHLLENEGGMGGGLTVYRPEAADPESSGALATCLWELPLLSHHYHPAVAKLATDVANMVSSSAEGKTLLGVTPIEAAAAYSTSQGGFRPAIQPPKTTGRSGARLRAAGFSCDELEARASKVLAVEGEKSDGSDENLVREFRLLFQRVRDYKQNEELRRENGRLLLMRRKFNEHLASKARKTTTTNTKSRKKAPQPSV